MAGGAKIETWIHGVITHPHRKDLNDPTKSAKCTAIGLFHMIGTSPIEVIVIQLDGSRNVGELAKWFRDQAETHCHDLPGAQTYSLKAFFDGYETPQLQLPFVTSGNADTHQNSGMMTEGPTEKGLVGQSMRHNEALMQGTFGAMSALMSQQAQFTKMVLDHAGTQAALIKDLYAENADAMLIVKEMSMKEGDKSQEHKMAQLKAVSDAATKKKFLEMAPAAVNALMGKEVIPHSAADSALLENLVRHLPEEQIMKVAEAFSGIPNAEMLLGPLMIRLGEIKDKIEKEAIQEKESIALALRGDDGGTGISEEEMRQLGSGSNDNKH